MYLSGDLVIVIENKAKVEDQAKSLKDNEDLLMDTSSVTKYASGAARTCSEGLRRSTVAHFARKVRGANIVADKHELKIQRRYAPERWLYSLRVRGPHFASKVSYNAGAATDDYAGQRNSPLRGRCRQT